METSTNPSLEYRVLYVDGERFELSNLRSASFSCRPEDIRRYMERDRWDLVFNALCYLTGVVEEGVA